MSQLLSKMERAELVEQLADDRMSHMFGDGLERDYIMDGFPVDKGLNHMSDAELLEELGHYDPDVETTDELRAARWRRELAGEDD